jgi:Cu+-exporting ATPase
MGGCCDQGYKPKNAENVARDPVCGMMVDRGKRDVLKITRDGKDFYFCSTGCMTRFIDDPGTYLDRKKSLFGFLRRR